MQLKRKKQLEHLISAKDGYTRSSSPQRNDSSVSELLKENKNLRAEIEQLVND